MADRNDYDRSTDRARDAAREYGDLPYGQDRPYTDRHVARGAYYGGVSAENNVESPARQRYEEYRRRREGGQGGQGRQSQEDREDAFRRTADYDLGRYGRGDYGTTYDEGYDRNRHLQGTYGGREENSDRRFDRSEEYPGRYLDQDIARGGRERMAVNPESLGNESLGRRDYAGSSGTGTSGGMGTGYRGGMGYADATGYEGFGGMGLASAPRGQQQGRFAGRGPKGYQRSDERIREEVCEHLTAHPDVDASDIEVRVENGDVTLTGRVDDRHQKRAAEDAAHEASGVREVHNHVRVQQQGMAGSSQREEQKS